MTAFYCMSLGSYILAAAHIIKEKDRPEIMSSFWLVAAVVTALLGMLFK